MAQEAHLFAAELLVVVGKKPDSVHLTPASEVWSLRTLRGYAGSRRRRERAGGSDQCETAAAAFSPISRSSQKRVIENGSSTLGVLPVQISSAIRLPATGPALKP